MGRRLRKMHIVYLIDGRHILDLLGEDSGTVDDCHPNDLGFFCMAQEIGAIIEKIFIQ